MLNSFIVFLLITFCILPSYISSKISSTTSLQKSLWIWQEPKPAKKLLITWEQQKIATQTAPNSHILVTTQNICWHWLQKRTARNWKLILQRSLRMCEKNIIFWNGSLSYSAWQFIKRMRSVCFVTAPKMTLKLENSKPHWKKCPADHRMTPKWLWGAKTKNLILDNQLYILR